MKKLAPDFYAEKIDDISPDFLKNLGAQWLLVDIDNTLVPRKSLEIPESSMRWIKSVRKRGLKVVLVSNSLSSRATTIARALQVESVLAPAAKPFLLRVKKFLSDNDIVPEASVFIGDQVFTDVLLCKRLGLRVVLLKPISDSDLPHTRILRNVEKLLITRWLKGSFTEKLGD